MPPAGWTNKKFHPGGPAETKLFFSALAPKKISHLLFHLKFFIPFIFIEFFHISYFHQNFHTPLFSTKFSHPLFTPKYSHLNIHIPLFFTERLVSEMAPRKKTLDLLHAKAAKSACWGQLNFFLSPFPK